MSWKQDELQRQMALERQAQQHSQRPDPIFGPDAFILPDAKPAPPPKQSTLHRWKDKGGVLGTLAAALIALGKIGAPLFGLLAKFKSLFFLKGILITGGSMLVSIWLEATLFGWAFAVGIVLLIFVHECGHAIASKSLGHPVQGMLFIPFCGAFVSMRRARNVVEGALIGIMGPVAGTFGGLVCLAIYLSTHGRFWLALAYFNFFINLFNLLPTPPLDGGWITPLISPKLMAVGLVLLFIVAHNNPLIWILAIMSIPRIIHGWKAGPTDPYYQAKAADRWKYGLAYVGLAAFLGLSVVVTHEELVNSRPISVQRVASADRGATYLANR